MIQLNYNLNGKEIAIAWSNKEVFREVVGVQTSWFGKTPEEVTDELMLNKLHSEYSWFMKSMLENTQLPENPTILDIGSGNSIIDLALYKHFDKKAKFYLLDGDKLYPPNNKEINLHDSNFITFNTWEPVLDAINTNDFIVDDFTFCVPNTEWNGEEYVPSAKFDAQFENVKVDMIISKSSCGLHYPINVYWEKILQILKPGGWLYVAPMINIGNQFEFVSSHFGEPKKVSMMPMDEIKKDRPNDFLRWEKLMPDAHNPNAIWAYNALWQRPL
jgi:SAM-dependent methyltransferase